MYMWWKSWTPKHAVRGGPMQRRTFCAKCAVGEAPGSEMASLTPTPTSMIERAFASQSSVLSWLVSFMRSSSTTAFFS
jgi:hypothetical protein